MSRCAGLFAFFAMLLSLSLSLPIAAQGQNLTSPLIVASGKMVGQTKPISATILYTPSETGLFRVSVYMCMAKPGNTPNRDWVFFLNWTDDAGKETDQLADLVVNSLPPSGYALSYILPAGFAFEAVGGEPITFAVDASSGTGTKGRYSLYYTVEQIQ
jgi:hypothetical protein